MKRLIDSIRWMKARRYWLANDFESAASVLQKIGNIGAYQFRVQTMLGCCQFYQGQIFESEESISKAEASLVSSRSKGIIQDDDYLYMTAYLQTAKNAAAAKRGETHLEPILSLDSVNLKKISKSIRTTFPLPNHPDWDDSSYNW